MRSTYTKWMLFLIIIFKLLFKIIEIERNNSWLQCPLKTVYVFRNYLCSIPSGPGGLEPNNEEKLKACSSALMLVACCICYKTKYKRSVWLVTVQHTHLPCQVVNTKNSVCLKSRQKQRYNYRCFVSNSMNKILISQQKQKFHSKICRGNWYQGLRKNPKLR